MRSLGASAWYRSLSKELAKEGFVGLSIDLFGGEVTTDLAQGDLLRWKALGDLKGTNGEIIQTWLDWLRLDPRTNRKVGIIGFSMGATMAIEFAKTAPVEATVLYYGVPGSWQQSDDPRGDVLGHFAKGDAQVPARKCRCVRKTDVG